MKLHSKSDELEEGLLECMPLVGLWQGTLYRATTVEYANRDDLLTGGGAGQSGGRWNPPGTFKAVYGSLEPETAMSESLASYREFRIPLSEAMPLVFVAVNVKAQAILDLTSGTVQKRLGVTSRRMRSTDWQAIQQKGEESLTQAIGRLAWEQSLEGLLVPSARVAGATNIVLFPRRRRRGSSWRIVGVRKLPRKNA